MGQTASKPEPGVRLQVIGAGLSRTGTTSFGAALQHLLKGPVHHGGTQMIRSDESLIKRWTEVARHTPYKSRQDKAFVLDEIEDLLDGFAACTDMPTLPFIPELMEIYPDAKVICSVRDPDKWWASMEPMVKRGKPGLLCWIFTFLPALRCFRAFHNAMDDGRFGEIYYRPNEEKKPSEKTYARHVAYLRSVVPKEKLFFYDVRDGWGPLCQILDVPVPKDLDFPKLNDSFAIETFIKESVMKGLVAWLGVGLTVSATAYCGLRMAKVL